MDRAERNGRSGSNKEGMGACMRGDKCAAMVVSAGQSAITKNEVTRMQRSDSRALAFLRVMRALIDSLTNV